MTGQLDQNRLIKLKPELASLEQQLSAMQPLLRQMHLLSSNAVSAAARAGSEGDAFRVLTQGIQELGQNINQDLQQAHRLLTVMLEAENWTQVQRLIKKLTMTLSEMPQSVKKGEYLAICCAVEAAHASQHSDSFDAVATMLKQLVADCRRQVASQQEMLDRLLTACE
ncbi:hypothetical protein [Methylophaga sp.]|jgi:methyl-accepting chemotaxis protein|uniref:hypothetical protein n=1 Tax=Methylophaga sp. TaxID=2024840 RepID=UPI0013FFF66A|nr:hypothetical protein [Methylophaga sp.]MTI63232.1 hypothetical protein [Methylophaga sp.]